ncbi:YciI family protein [Streptomyces sp. NPDC004065]|uniref:YciI family protein n=1 Tax=Streptomyces sp. NPDC004065 TaxID=3364689 RepID=UPI00384FA6B8
MEYYLLSVIQPSEAAPPSAEALADIMGSVEAFHRELRAAGAWVFAGGLDGPETATVLRPEGEDVEVAQGPYTRGKEYLGGLCLIKAPDAEAALEWGRKASLATTLPIEVRPFLHTAED